MSVLIDTNVLLRRTQPNHPQHVAAIQSILLLMESDETIYFSPQVISEFWNVVTRPVASNGLGFSVHLAIKEVEKIERSMALLPDAPEIYPEWKRLVTRHQVLGSKVHDARLVATMIVHGIGRILTFNGRDFERYNIEVLTPKAV